MYTLPSFPNGEIKSELLIFGIAPNSDVEEDESLPPKPLTAQGSGGAAQHSIPREDGGRATESDPLEMEPLTLTFQKFSDWFSPKAHPLAFSVQLSQSFKPTRISAEHPAS